MDKEKRKLVENNIIAKIGFDPGCSPAFDMLVDSIIEGNEQIFIQTADRLYALSGVANPCMDGMRYS